MNDILLEFMGVVIRLRNILVEHNRLQETLYEVCIRMRILIEEEQARRLMAEEREDQMDVVAEEESSSEEESESSSEEEGELEDFVYSFL